MLVEQTYVTERGRRRRRMVRVDLDELARGLASPTSRDRGDWQRIRQVLQRAVSETTFAIWLRPVELIAIDGDGRLVLSAPAGAADWTADRYGGLLARCAEQVGRELRFASGPEVCALGGAERRVQQQRQEGAG